MKKTLRKSLSLIAAVGIVVSIIPQAVTAEKLPSITSSLERYAVDEEKKIITMPDTTVEKLTGVINGLNGTTVTVKDEDGNNVDSGAVKNTMKLVASNGGTDYEYSIKLKAPVKAFDVSNALDGIPDGQLLFDAYRQTSKAFSINSVYTNSDPLAASGYLVGFAGGHKGFGSILKQSDTGSGYKYEVYKEIMPTTTVSGYKFTYPEFEGKKAKYAYHKAGDMTDDTGAESGDKLVIKFKLYLGTDGMFSINPYHSAYKSSGDIGGYDLQATEGVNVGIGDRVQLDAETGVVTLGGLIRSSAGYAMDFTKSGKTYGKQIGTCVAEKLYDVTIVESRGTWDDNGTTKSTVITEGVYLNGQNLLREPNVLQISEEKEYFAVREISFFTGGTSYMSGLNIYMTDNYEPKESADLTIASLSQNLEIYTQDPLEHNMRSIKGYSGTAGDLKNAISFNSGARIDVLAENQTDVLEDNTLLKAGMFLSVSNIENESEKNLYILSDKLNIGNFEVSGNNGTITIEKTIKAYKAENKDFAMIISSFDKKWKIADVKQDQKTINSAGTYKLKVNIDSSFVIKMMLWDSLIGMRPYVPSEFYALSISDLKKSLNGVEAVSYDSVDASLFE